MHRGRPVRVWGLGQRSGALATREEVPARQTGPAEQVYLSAQGLDPTSSGSYDTRQPATDLGPGRDGISTISTDSDGEGRIEGLDSGSLRCDSPSQYTLKSVGHQSMVSARQFLSDS